MHHFLFEFITGGGLSEETLSDSLINEGEMMVQTLINELKELNSEISICRDSRLPLIDDEIKKYVIESKIDDKLPAFLKKADVCWLIAPETGLRLEEYAKLFIQYGKLFIGSSPEAIKLTSSKFGTIKVLSDAGVKSIETKWIYDLIPKSKTGWVVKPDDGVGAENTRLVNTENDLSQLISDVNNDGLIVQPYVQGKHMSMSLLVFNNDVRLLACNKQYIEIEKNSIKLKKIGVNECLQYENQLLKLAEKIVSVIPGLAGYIGVDLIEVEGELFVFEINPRFTTAYAGLSESMGCNVVSMILNTFLDKELPDINLNLAKPVLIAI
jgi:predicted ATP-grasp superfamily ATP-dependent carboligase